MPALTFSQLQDACNNQLLVKIAPGPAGDQSWDSGANRHNARWGDVGQVLKMSTGHGTCVLVRHDNAPRDPVWYNLEEIESYSREPAWKRQAASLSETKSAPATHCYLYGVFGQTGAGGVDLVKAQLFSSTTPTFFGVDPAGLVVLLRETKGADLGEARSTMLRDVENGAFPEPWLSKIRWHLRSEIAQSKGREAWIELYDREHFTGKYEISKVRAAAGVAVGDRVRYVPTPSREARAKELGIGVVFKIFRFDEGNRYQIGWVDGTVSTESPANLARVE